MYQGVWSDIFQYDNIEDKGVSYVYLFGDVYDEKDIMPAYIFNNADKKEFENRKINSLVDTNLLKNYIKIIWNYHHKIKEKVECVFYIN